MVHEQTSARSSWDDGWCARWTTNGPSTSRAGESFPTTSSCTSRPKDYEGFSEISDVLQTELVEAAREYARSEGYHFLGPVKVELSVDQTQKAGRFEVLATLRQSAEGEAPGAASLVLPSGQRVALGDAPVTVGRLSECTIPLNDNNVSRRHAEIRPNRQNFVVIDLGSTNGTMVNGTRIYGETALSDGDIISFGSTYVRFEAS